MPPPAWRLDTERFPLVLSYVAHGDGKTPPEMTSVTRMLEQLERLRGQKVIVVDLSYAVPDAMRRRMFIDWTKKNWASFRAELLGVACIAPGAFQRSIITGLLWFIRPSCPVETFENREQAIAWASDVLERAGLSVPRSSLVPMPPSIRPSK